MKPMPMLHALSSPAWAKKITSRSTFAARVVGVASNGDADNEQLNTSNVYSIGGFNQIRGYEYREFFGDRASFLNLELRFPLIDALVFPGNWGIQGIQGFLFFDTGAAWYRGDRVYDANLGFTGALRKFDFHGGKELFAGSVGGTTSDERSVRRPRIA